MARKKWAAQEDITPELLRFREKRKWQIALRRYVIERQASVFYAPYFGLDINTMRAWFEIQFENGLGWGNFGEQWQFEHVIPVNHFDFTLEKDLKQCWGFLNLQVSSLKEGKRRTPGDLQNALIYFKEVYASTNYSPCLDLIHKVEQIGATERMSTANISSFISTKRDYLSLLNTYSSFEFELLNAGRNEEDIAKEIALLKKMDN